MMPYAGAGVHHPDAHKVGKAAALYRHGVPGAGVVQQSLQQSVISHASSAAARDAEYVRAAAG